MCACAAGSRQCCDGEMFCVLNVQWQEERIMGASLMLAGLKQENSAGFSARLLGLALIGVYALVMGETMLFQTLN